MNPAPPYASTMRSNSATDGTGVVAIVGLNVFFSLFVGELVNCEYVVGESVV